MMFLNGQIWQKRSMITNFAVLNLKVKYKSSLLGLVWMFLEPLLYLTVLYLVFSNLFGSDIQYFPLYLLLGLVVWKTFSSGTSLGMHSIMSQKNLMLSINMPAAIPVLGAITTSIIVFSLEMIVFGLFLVWFQFIPPMTILLLPLIAILGFFLALGVALPLSVLNIKYRDFQFIWTVIIHIGFFVNPIFYRANILPEFLQGILQYIPTVYIIESARGAALYGTLPLLEDTVRTLCITLGIFLVGYLIFSKLKDSAMEEL